MRAYQSKHEKNVFLSQSDQSNQRNWLQNSCGCAMNNSSTPTTDRMNLPSGPIVIGIIAGLL
jgi:hypothetical protein